MSNRNRSIDWRTYPLSTFVKTLENGSRPRGGVSKYTSGKPSISAEQIRENGMFVWDRVKFVPKQFYESAKRGIIQTNDILIVKDGATTGKCAYVDETFPYSKAMVNEHTYILRTDKRLLPKYAYYYLRSEECSDYFKNARLRCFIGGLSSGFIDDILIPVPPLTEQRRIVARIEELTKRAEEERNLIREIDTELSNFTPALLAKAFRGEL